MIYSVAHPFPFISIGSFTTISLSLRFGVGWPSAVAVLSKQVAAGVQVDVLHSNAILSSFSDSLPARVVATWLVTVQLLQWMGCVAVRSDTRSFNIARSHVVQGHSTQGGRWEIASFLLEKQKHCALDMSMVSIGCSADAFAKTARWMDAMLCLTTRPNVATWLPSSKLLISLGFEAR